MTNYAQLLGRTAQQEPLQVAAYETITEEAV